MSRRSTLLLALAALGLIVAAIYAQRALRPGPVRELDEANFAQAQVDFAALAGGQSSAPPADFAVQIVDQPFHGLVIEEPEGSCRGGGTYLLRTGLVNVPLLISAPHRGADRLTGPLALKLMVEQRFAAAAWNSVPRRSRCGGGGSDLARLARHPFTAFSAGFAQAFPAGRIVQIHGFDTGRRTTAEGRAASIILSSGSKQVSPAVLAVAECLRRRLPGERIGIFPADVSELGARLNAQGRRLRAMGFNGFVHAELSVDVRAMLMRDPDARRDFGACLKAGL
ncbi:MAG: hypothetical protein ABIS23_04650 [Sphingomicrobium sp.]